MLKEEAHQNPLKKAFAAIRTVLTTELFVLERKLLLQGQCGVIFRQDLKTSS